tara:strand:- start:584 stop:757 length:174 start_codon:yes stop_codon:yes gene_type:complete
MVNELPDIGVIPAGKSYVEHYRDIMAAKKETNVRRSKRERRKKRLAAMAEAKARGEL